MENNDAKRKRKRKRVRQKNPDGKVVRLRYYTRNFLFKKYPFCLKCGSLRDLTVDHILPISLGGTNDISNLQVLCMKCNTTKGSEVIDYR